MPNPLMSITPPFQTGVLTVCRFSYLGKTHISVKVKMSIVREQLLVKVLSQDLKARW